MKGVTAAVLAAVIALMAYLVLQDYQAPPRPHSLGPIRDTTHTSTDTVDPGRYKTPFLDVQFPGENTITKALRRKRWHFISMTTEAYFVAFAIVDLGYVGNAFAYLMERSTGNYWEFSNISPLAQNIQSFAPSSTSGCTVFNDGHNQLLACYDDLVEGWNIVVDVELHADNHSYASSKAVRIHGMAHTVEALALIYPITPEQLAYTHKGAGMSGNIRMILDGNTESMDAMVAMDWTYSYAERVTKWKWASLAVQVGDDRIGINLSDDVYVDNAGVSQENAVWMNGKVYDAGKVAFRLPSDPRNQVWKLESVDQSDIYINLSFQPQATREELQNFGIIVSSFIQALGEYSGTISVVGRTFSIENAAGVAEKHYAKW